MKNRYPSILITFICFLIFLVSCQTEDLPVLNVPEDEWIIYKTFEFQNIDSARYWGDSDKMRLQSGVIMLRPANQTYLKRFIGTGDQAMDPAQMKWSKEESGKYTYSLDSTRILFSNDPHVVYYFPGQWNNGIYHSQRLEQYDSIWYSISFFSMGISGRFIYSAKPD
jgi:hypothetical protein